MRTEHPWWSAIAPLVLLVVTTVATLMPRPAAAAPEDEGRYRLDLVTVGPGDSFYTRAGHAALAVVEVWPDGREIEVVYNYGDADFSDPWLGAKFLFGQPVFFVSIVGDLYETVEYYGPMQNRDVYRQRLALSSEVAQRVGARLAEQTRPENREYPYHYLDRTCTTELRTLLDEVTDGALSTQLADPDPWTVRDYQELTFDGALLVAMVSDAIFGRLHDEPIDRFYAMMWPRRMREYLQKVRVPDPHTGQPVPLASQPELLAERGGPPATVGPNRGTYWFAPSAAVLVLLVAVGLRRKGATPTRAWGAWLLAWALPMGAIGLAIAVLCIASSVPQMRCNELALSVLATDLVLIAPAVSWLRGRTTIPRWLPRYATARLVVVAIAVVLRGVGVFIQQPWVTPIASLLCGLGLWWLIRDRD